MSDPAPRPAPDADPELFDLRRVAALIDLGRYDDAVRAATEIIGRNPGQPRAWCLLAQAQLGAGNLGAALHAAQQAVVVDPQGVDGYQFTSLAYSRMGRHHEAVQAARQAVHLAPSAWQTMARLAWAHAGNPRTTDWNEARTAASRATELAPESPGAHLAVGGVEAAANNKKAARSAYEKVLSLDPQNPIAHNELARLNLRRGPGIANPGGLAKAATGFATALQADPTATASRRNLDLVVRVFLARAAYLLFLASYIDYRGFDRSGSVASRLIPLAILVVPAVFVARFVWRLTPTLQGYVRRSLVRPWPRLVATLLEGAAVLAIVVGSLAPTSLRPTLAGTAFALALVGRIVLWLGHRQEQSRR